jgi:hypothetical protein
MDDISDERRGSNNKKNVVLDTRMNYVVLQVPGYRGWNSSNIH